MVMLTKQIRLTKDLLNELQMLVEWGLYPNISEAVRDAVRRLVTGKEAPIKPLQAPQTEEKETKVKEIKKKLDKELKKQFQKPKGTEDYFPQKASIRSQIFSILKKNALKYGFLEVDSPIIEDLNLLKAKQGEDIVGQIFTIEQKGEEELALRAEFTPSLARMFIAKQKAIPKPVKWFCINKVFRYERPQAGRAREFFQFNVEIYGSNKPEGDAEIINLAIDSLKDLGLTENDFFVKINNRKLIQGLLLELIDEKRLEVVMRTIDKKTKLTEEEWDEEFKKTGLDVVTVNKIKNILDSDINSLNPKNELAIEGLKELKEILILIDSKFVKVDLSTVRGLAYYTGIVFEIFDSRQKFRSITGGGRYDKMIELFRGEPTPATGFGMGYSTLRLLLKEKNLLPEPDTSVDYFIVIINDEVRQKAFEIASKLREKYKVSIDINRRNIRNQLDYADKTGAKKVIFIGPDELKQNKIKIKDMKTGKETITELNKL